MGTAVPADDMPSTIVPSDDMPEAASSPRAELVNRMAAQPKIGDALVDPIHAAASGLYHGVVGGYKGLATLVADRDPDAAARAVNEETAKTYVAPKADLSGADSKLRPAIEQMNQPMAPTALGDWASEHGASPALSTGLAVLPTALASFAAPRSLGPAKVPASVVPESAQAVVNRAYAGQSMGAAGVAPDLSVAPPELHTAISQAAQKTGGDVHPVALERHLDAAQLPLPEGMEPFWLRKGQAINDAQQISDEKNLRADPDTQGILTDSITDQDKKLVASMGEIRRRATPEIVQRNNTEHDQTAINAIKKQDNDTITDIRAKYKVLADANGGDLPIDTSAVLENINAQLKKASLRKLAENHDVLSEIYDSMKSGNPIDFETFDNWRSSLADMQRHAGPEGKAAGIFHGALNDMPLTPEAEPLRALSNTARNAAKARFDMIKRNPAYKAAINDNVPKVNGLHDLTEDSPLAGNFLNRFALGNSDNASSVYINRLKESVPDPIATHITRSRRRPTAC